MSHAFSTHRTRRWVHSTLAVFAMLGLGFGSWLSRLPAVRDHVGATTLEMSIYGLCLATGCLVGLVSAGRTVASLGPRRTLLIGAFVQAIAMPSAVGIIWTGALVPGLAVLFVYGFAFATSDVAMNVTGASAERALGKPRMPVLHAGYSIGAVVALGIGSLAERLGVPVPWHLAAVFTLLLIGLILALRGIPHPREEAAHFAETEQDSAALDSHGPETGTIPIITSTEGRLPAFTAMTGSIPIVVPEPPHGERTATGRTRKHGPGRPPNNPWRDPRVLLIGLIGLSTSIAEGTASDWLPLSLVDGRGLSNETAAIMLSVFFISMVSARVGGSVVITRFGRVSVLRASALLCALGVVSLILVPSAVGMIIGALAWGLGSALGFPVAISAAADDPKTAVHNVAVVSAISYTAMLVGPMAFGFLGEHIGLLTSFWVIAAIALLGGAVAFAAREPWRRK